MQGALSSDAREGCVNGGRVEAEGEQGELHNEGLSTCTQDGDHQAFRHVLQCLYRSKDVICSGVCCSEMVTAPSYGKWASHPLGTLATYTLQNDIVHNEYETAMLETVPQLNRWYWWRMGAGGQEPIVRRTASKIRTCTSSLQSATEPESDSCERLRL